jgi:hypothetical protein
MENPLNKLLGSVIGEVAGIVDRFVTTGDEKLKAMLELNKMRESLNEKLLAYEASVAGAQKEVLIAEIQSQSKLARAWRPALMYVFMAILVNNFILAPYLKAIWISVPILEVPAGMWGLLTLAMGGYVGGRTWEKIKGVSS